MTTYAPSDVTLVIPTRHRWRLLERTLECLAHQTVSGFETLVVVDGTEEAAPTDLDATRVLVQPHAGPGSARNRGAASSERPLLLFLGDDMLPEPTLIEQHLAGHAGSDDPRTGVLGRVEWHPEVGRNRLNRWLDWSHSQFDFASIKGDDASWAHFYSCNVSLPRSLFDAVGGFDSDFTFDYEDLDIGYRLGQAGMRLRYRPDALVRHLHPYDWPALERRYRSRAEAERVMMAKHDWFTPYFGERCRQALRTPPVAARWAVAADRLPSRPQRLVTPVRRRANRFYHQRLGMCYLDAWHAVDDLAELKEYLGSDYDERRLREHLQEVLAEEEQAADELDFYRTSSAYLYDLTVFAMSATKLPYHWALRRHVPLGSRLLDYGCGIGSDGLRLIDLGYDVSFADFDNPSTQYLRWRLHRRGLSADLYNVEEDVPGGFDAVYCFDVIEHVADPFDFLARLEERAAVVAVNFLEPDPHDPHPHQPLPISELLRHAKDRGLLHYRRYHGRSHLVIYRSVRPSKG